MSTEYGSTAPRPLTFPLELREGGNVESIAANMALTQRSAQVQYGLENGVRGAFGLRGAF